MPQSQIDTVEILEQRVVFLEQQSIDMRREMDCLYKRTVVLNWRFVGVVILILTMAVMVVPAAHAMEIYDVSVPRYRIAAGSVIGPESSLDMKTCRIDAVLLKLLSDGTDKLTLTISDRCAWSSKPLIIGEP